MIVDGGALGTEADWFWYTEGCGVEPVSTGAMLTVEPQQNTTYFARAEGLCNTTDCIEFSIYVHQTLPNAPIAVDPVEIGSEGFTASWEEVQNATHYLLDVAYDLDFNNFVLPYHNANAGNVTEHTVAGLDPETVYYYRIFAVNSCGSSNSSNMIVVETQEAGSECPDLNIGQYYGGGVVVYTEYPGVECGYLIVTNSDQSSGATWANCSSWMQNAYNLPASIGSGKSNTEWIVENCTNSVAALCDNFSHEGFHDWFLPSQNELSGPVYNSSNLAGFTSVQTYWSSTSTVQWGSFVSHAVTIDPTFNSSGSQGVQSGTFPVRCVRAF